MPAFDYIAVDQSGQTQTGRIDAPSQEVVQSMLAAAGWNVTSITPATLVAAELPVPARDGASLSLLTNLRALSEDLTPARVRQAVHRMADRLERGESLPIAYSAIQGDLPPSMRILLDQGLSRGRIDNLLSVYLDHIRRLADVRLALWVSLAYPLILVLTLMALCLGVSTYVVPIFEEIYGDFGTELPGLTTFVIQSSHLVNVLVEWSFVWIPGVLMLGWLLLRLIAGPGGPQWVFRRIPCVGSVFRWCSLARCCETLAMLVEHETPLPEAFRTTASTLDDYDLAARMRRAANDLETGTASSAHLPAELGGILRWTANPQQLVRVLRSTGDIFSARSRVDLHLTRWLMEPIVLLIIAVGIGLIFLSLFLPLVKLLNDLS